MRNYSISLSNSNWKNNLLDDYLKGSDFLKSFYQYEPKFDNLNEAINDRKKFPIYRGLLADVLSDQNKEFLHLHGLADTIGLLSLHNTFTITTGHQLGIAGGPLFFIYKIITAIKLTKQLNSQNTNNLFVPVFWMASEDHDFEEIASVQVFNNKLTWNYTDAAGACGELSTDSLNDLIEELKKINGESSNAIELNKILSDCYQTGLTLADATRKLVYAILGEYGVVVIDGADARFKRFFIDVMRNELLNHSAHQKVNETSERLAAKYRPQVFPREVNLFYKDKNLRERFVDRRDGIFKVTNTDLFFPKDILLDMLDKYPERFSPNVVLRPLYQERILPNIAYVGGAGELAYWLQLKSLFSYHHIFYPMLINRNNALIISEKLLKKASSAGINEIEIFQDEQALIKLVLERTVTDDFSAKENIDVVTSEFDAIAVKAISIDASTEKYIQAERQKTINALENIEKKMLQAIKKKNENSLNVCKQITEEVFPNHHPQEREQSFIPFYLKEGKEGIQYLLENFKPLSNEILIVVTE
jgi:bacillithiol biosynthesis cysteine-adding enzyme BshC